MGEALIDFEIPSELDFDGIIELRLDDDDDEYEYDNYEELHRIGISQWVFHNGLGNKSSSPNK
jgi:hypothetical protein